MHNIYQDLARSSPRDAASQFNLGLIENFDPASHISNGQVCFDLRNKESTAIARELLKSENLNDWATKYLLASIEANRWTEPRVKKLLEIRNDVLGKSGVTPDSKAAPPYNDLPEYEDRFCPEEDSSPNESESLLWYPANEKEGLLEFNIWREVDIILREDKTGQEFQKEIKGVI